MGGMDEFNQFVSDLGRDASSKKASDKKALEGETDPEGAQEQGQKPSEESDFLASLDHLRKEVKQYVPKKTATESSSADGNDDATHGATPLIDEPKTLEELSEIQTLVIRSVCRLIRRYIKFDGDNLEAHRGIKDAFTNAVKGRNFSKLGGIIQALPDKLNIQDPQQLQQCTEDSEKALQALMKIDANTIPWTLFSQQLAIAIDDVLSGSMDRLNRTGVFTPSDFEGAGEGNGNELEAPNDGSPGGVRGFMKKLFSK